MKSHIPLGQRFLVLVLSCAFVAACVEVPYLRHDEPRPQAAKAGSRQQAGSEDSVRLREARLLAAVDEENSVFFDPGSTEINAEARIKLARHVARLKADDKLQLTLIGQTGDSGSSSYNLALAERQADAVYKWLRAAGVPASQLRRYPVGGEKTAAGCVSERCLQRMRRVELVYSS